MSEQLWIAPDRSRRPVYIIGNASDRRQPPLETLNPVAVQTLFLQGSTPALMDALPMVRVMRDGGFVVVPATPPSLHDPATGVASKDVVIRPVTGPPVSARLYLPDLSSDDDNNEKKKKKKLPVVIYYHGGGFTFESPFSPTYHPYLNSLAGKAGVLAVSVDYRLAPAHPIPAAYDDAWEALQWVAAASGDEWLVDHADLSRLFLAGDSAGGNIVHNVAMRAGNLNLKLKGVALVHPFFWSKKKRIGREADWQQDSVLNPPRVDRVWSVVCPGAAAGEEDPRLNPLAEGAPSLKELGCGRVLVCVAGKDLLADRGRAYYEGLKGSGWGGEAELVVSEDEDHAFHLFKIECDKATEMMERLVAFFNH